MYCVCVFTYYPILYTRLSIRYTWDVGQENIRVKLDNSTIVRVSRPALIPNTPPHKRDVWCSKRSDKKVQEKPTVPGRNNNSPRLNHDEQLAKNKANIQLTGTHTRYMLWLYITEETPAQGHFDVSVFF